MAKSMRSKREKRLRAIRREIVEPFYEKKEAAKLAAQEAALAAPKLPVKSKNNSNSSMDISGPSASNDTGLMDVEMTEGGQSSKSLKPIGVIGKKMKRKIKLSKKKRHGKGKIRRKPNV